MDLNLKSVLTGSAATIALLAASSANASGYYVGLFGGISTLEDTFSVAGADTGATVTTVSTHTQSKYTHVGSSVPFGSFTWDTKPYNSVDGTNTGLGSNSLLFTTFSPHTRTGGTRSTIFGAVNSFDDGFVIGGVIGFDYDSAWRSELEVAFRQNDVNGTGGYAGVRNYTHLEHANYQYWFFNYSYSTTSGGSYSATATVHSNTKGGTITKTQTKVAGAMAVDGTLETMSFMANVWYDFNLNGAIHPFVGGGIGVAHANLDYSVRGTVDTGTNGLFGGTEFGFDDFDTAWGLAYQLGAGIGIDVGSATLSAQYRYFNTTGMDLNIGDDVDISAESHNFLIGLNFALGGS